jgi:hypothetical protein
MIRRFLAWVLLVLTVGALGTAPVAAVLSYNGFCMERVWFLTDQEAIDAVVETILDRKHAYIEIDSKPILVDVVPYESMEQFHRINRNCCHARDRFMADGPYTSVWGQVLGWAAEYVWVKYKIAYMAEDGTKRWARLDTMFVVTNCGTPYAGGGNFSLVDKVGE